MRLMIPVKSMGLWDLSLAVDIEYKYLRLTFAGSSTTLKHRRSTFAGSSTYMLIHRVQKMFNLRESSVSSQCNQIAFECDNVSSLKGSGSKYQARIYIHSSLA